MFSGRARRQSTTYATTMPSASLQFKLHDDEPVNSTLLSLGRARYLLCCTNRTCSCILVKLHLWVICWQCRSLS